MPHTLVAFWEDIDAAGALANLAAVADPHIATNGDDLTVPTINQIAAMAAMVASGGDGYARIEAPSLLTKSRLYISPINGNGDAPAEPDSPPKVVDMRSNPLPLRTNEDVQALVHSNTTAGEPQSVLLWLSDGPIVEMSGQIFTTRATAAQVLGVGVWTNSALTFQENLPVGRYAIVGMSYIGVSAIAARLVFRGGEGWRPGVLGRDSDSDEDNMMFRMGQFGLFGEFESVQPPSVDFLANLADTAQDVLLDLIQVRSG